MLLLAGSSGLLAISPAALGSGAIDASYLLGAIAVVAAGAASGRFYRWFHRLPEQGLVPRLTLVLGIGFLLNRALTAHQTGPGLAGVLGVAPYVFMLLLLCPAWVVFRVAPVYLARHLRSPRWAWGIPLALAGGVWAYQMVWALSVLARTGRTPGSREMLMLHPFGGNVALFILHVTVIGLAIVLATWHLRLAQLPPSLLIARITTGLPRSFAHWLRSFSLPQWRYLRIPVAGVLVACLFFVSLKENGTTLCLLVTALVLVTVVSRRWAVGIVFAVVSFWLLCNPAVLTRVLSPEATPVMRSVAYRNPWRLPSTRSVERTGYLLTLPRALQLQAMAGPTGLSPAIAPLNDRYKWVPMLTQDAPVVGVTLMFGLVGALAVIAAFLQLLLALLAAARDMHQPRAALVVFGQVTAIAALAAIGWSGFLKVIPIVGLPWPGYSRSMQEVLVLALIVAYAGSILARTGSGEVSPEIAIPLRQYAGRLAVVVSVMLLVPVIYLAWYTLPGAGPTLRQRIIAERPKDVTGVWNQVQASPYADIVRLELLSRYQVVDRARERVLAWRTDGTVSYCHPYLWPFSGMAQLVPQLYRDAEGDVLDSCREAMLEDEQDPALGLAYHARTRFSPWITVPRPQLVTLTIDARVQEVTGRKLVAQARAHGTPGRCRGAAAAWDVASGEILGLFYTPRPIFASNRVTEIALQQALGALRSRAPYDDVWTNRLYVTARPGSSFKVVTTTAYLMWRRAQGEPLRESELQRLTGAIARSETQTGYFQGLARAMGGDYLYRVVTDDEDGFGLSLPPNTTPEEYRRGFRNAGRFRGLDKVAVGMGMAEESVFDQMKVISCIANHGLYVKPHYIRTIVRGSTQRSVPPAIRGAPAANASQRIPAEVADLMASVMESAVARTDATTHSAFSALRERGVAVGAKTGTGDSVFSYLAQGGQSGGHPRRVRRNANTVWTIAYGRRNGHTVGVVAMLEDVPSGRLADRAVAPLAADLLSEGLKAVGGL